MMIVLPLLLTLLIYPAFSFHSSIHSVLYDRSRWYARMTMHDNDDEQPCSPRKQSWKAVQRLVHLATNTTTMTITLGCTSSILSTMSPKVSHAIGDLYEFQSNDHFLYGIDLQVNNIQTEVDMLEALVQQSCQVIRRYQHPSKGENSVDLSFGPTTLTKSSAFKPGISTFRSYGGHAALSLHSSLNTVSHIGNDLQFIKIGTDSLRISKGVEKGTVINEKESITTTCI